MFDQSINQLIPALPDDTSLVTYTVKVNGMQLPDTVSVQTVQIQKAVNRIPLALLSVLDGDVARQEFRVSDTNLLTPGNPIEISIGYHQDETLLFKGIIIRHALKIREDRTYLDIECKDEAVKLTVARRNKYFFEQKDSEIIEEILNGANLSHDVAATQVKHREMVQFNATNWDFINTRAEANGLLVVATDGTVRVISPDFEQDAKLGLTYGANIFELEAEMDARDQYPAAKIQAWNPADQSLRDASAPAGGGAFGGLSSGLPSSVSAIGGALGVDLPGDSPNTDFTTVMGWENFPGQHTGSLASEELDAWASAQFNKSKLAKLRGSVRFQGAANILPGDMINLQGVGQRHEGKVFVTSVLHHVSEGAWYCTAQFGLSATWFARDYNDVTDLPAAGLLPAIHGLQIGVVTALENDPEGEDRIQVRLPMVSAQGEGIWSRIACQDAGKNRGAFWRPELGDEVVVGFLNDDPREAIVVGSLNSSAKPAPLPAKDDNHEKGWVTRSEMRMIFNDEKKSLTIETPGGKKFIIDEDADKIQIEDEHNNRITMNNSGIVIESASDLTLKAAQNLNIEAPNISNKAQASFKAEAQGQAQLKASGDVVVKGAFVRIN